MLINSSPALRETSCSFDDENIDYCNKTAGNLGAGRLLEHALVADVEFDLHPGGTVVFIVTGKPECGIAREEHRTASE